MASTAGSSNQSIYDMSLRRREVIWPKLRGDSFQKTSDPTNSYNCVAFALGDTQNWHDDTRYGKWDDRAPRDGKVESYAKYFQLFGFVTCEEPVVENGFEKIALFATADGEFTHVAIQMSDGTWKSKLGSLEDISHAELTSISEGDYGTPRIFMKRETAIQLSAP